MIDDQSISALVGLHVWTAEKGFESSFLLPSGQSAS